MKTNAMLCTAYNLSHNSGKPMTSNEVKKLSKGDKYFLLCWLRDNPSELFLSSEVNNAIDTLIN